MATLTIIDLPDKVRDRLRVRAAKRGVSKEAEARAILSDAVTSNARRTKVSISELQDWVIANRKPGQGDSSGSAALVRDRRRDTIVEVVRDGRQPRDVFGSNYQRESGHETVAGSMADGAMSTVNLAEVLSRMKREGISARTLMTKLSSAGLSFIDIDQAQAEIVADIREAARQRGVGLADCCCMALALHHRWPVLTADRIWATLGFDIEVRLVR